MRASLLKTKIFVLFGLFLLAHSVFAQTKNIDRSVLGKTFFIPGPNCFATALRVTGLYPTFRAVGESEFRAFTDAFCSFVEEPQEGDIGAYQVPNYFFTHAYVFSSNGFGIDKPGVDYLGKTMVSEKTLETIDYIAFASVECRRYSTDISQCSNLRRAFRCHRSEPNLEIINKHNLNVIRWEKLASVLLEEENNILYIQKIYSELHAQLQVLKQELLVIEKSNIANIYKTYYRERIKSLSDQLIFIEIYIKGKS